MPLVSVLMPAFNQAPFVRRAIESLRAQTLREWELIVVDDGSTDATRHIIRGVGDERIRYERLLQNQGLGAALNRGLALARADQIAYLPSDDLFYRDHLASLIACLRDFPSACLAFSGLRHHYNRYAPGRLPDKPLQLVQVMHRRYPERWMERAELATDDLDRMCWSKLRPLGEFIGTGSVTCEWVDHPGQHHKALIESDGGVNPYRVQYGVREPLRIHSSAGNRLDEGALYARFRERPDTPLAPDGLKIVLCGELAYNPDRVLALEERGNKLYGLWMPDPQWYNWVGPLPFGHVTDLPVECWKEALKRIQPDVIYGLLNWQAVRWAHHVLKEAPGIPFVWHFKESPWICLEKGTWTELIELYSRAAGQIYSSEEMRDWFRTVLPRQARPTPSMVLDGDLPKAEWFEGAQSPRLSARDGEIHTVVPGRPIGLHPEDVAALGEHRIHLHFYGDFTHGQWRGWIDKALRLAPARLHLHSHVDPDRWVAEFSLYDAGWLHYFESGNHGEVCRSNWDDLNLPARMSTLAAAGLPMLLRNNFGHRVAVDTIARRFGNGIFFNDIEEAAGRLEDSAEMEKIRANALNSKSFFTFDHHVGSLLDFLRLVISPHP